MDMDIIIDESPDTVTLQSETFDKMVALVQAGVQFPQEVLLETSDLDSKTKAKVIKMMEKQQQADPLAAQAGQLQLFEKQADIEKTMAEVANKNASTTKIEAETAEILLTEQPLAVPAQ